MTLTVQIDDEGMRKLAEEIAKAISAQNAKPPAASEAPSVAPAHGRLAFTLKETAGLLGDSYVTVYRLVQRGLLKPSSALRVKIISRQEIERFLRRT